ncbi:MAG: FumA C-terminus/TtdB family hydratase beta subunit [Oscillospiraceae bacterium]|jgi:fumarate hydratase subunit beta|nr:FumA C-terminus/TtdB family hydratase beta subunit [Oscillospiraceae bacterium]
MIKEINTENLRDYTQELKHGEKILLSGVVYTARDAAHKKMFELLDNGENLPFEIKNAVIYYAGPTGTPPGKPIGSCGPTTSSRMDKFSPRLLDLGLLGMIGKGERSPEVIEAIKRNKAIYLCAIGGAGALAAHSIKTCEVIAFPELGCESIKRLTINRFPLLVSDC